MLAQNFKTPTDLEISDMEFGALVTVLGMLEREELKHVPSIKDRLPISSGGPFTGHFNMAHWSANGDCGTICCIGGAAQLISPGIFFEPRNKALQELFYAYSIVVKGLGLLAEITAEQAATALRSYLTTGDANWAEAISSR